jgi:hypothetical protein
MHRRASFLRGVPLRETDIRGLAGRSRRDRLLPSLGFSPGGAPGFFCAPRRFAPADGCRAISGVPGPRVVSLAARPTRFIFFGLTDLAPGGGVVGRGLSFARRSTSGLRSRLRSASRSNEPRDRSCLGLCLLQGCGRVSAHAIGLDPDHIISLRNPAPACSGANRASLSAHGFSTLAPIANRRKSRPFSVLMGLMPCRPERLRGPFRANSLSEVLHRP